MKFKHHRLALLLLVSLPTATLACGKDDDYIGTICMTAAQWCPRGTLEADGRVLPVAGNNGLADVLGYAYGGQTGVNFALPDLRGRAPLGLGQGPGLSLVTQGARTGAEQVTLVEANLPAHSHSFSPVGDSGKINLSLKVSTGLGNSDAPSTANKYLAAVQPVADTGSGTAEPIKLWSSSLTSPVEIGGLSASTTLSGGAIGKTGGGQPVAVRSPGLGVRYCVVVHGTYPPRE